MSHPKHILKQLLPAHVIQAKIHKQVFLRFAQAYGFIYFGLVNQRHNDHRLVRGLTLTAKHRDSHYCLGAHESYDVTLVERVSTITYPHRSPQKHTWLIMAFDLHTVHDIPHLFLTNTRHDETFFQNLFTKFPYLTKVSLGGINTYHQSFLRQRTMYASLRDVHEVADIFVPALANKINDHLGNLSFEIYDKVLYIYAEHQRPTYSLLSRMLHEGIWLAKEVDAKA